MKITKSQRNNIILLIIVLVMIIPQTRQPLQVLLHKGLALFSPSVIDKEERAVVSNYNWNLVDENGVSFDFNTAKGKVVVLNFWATWCPPCIAEMPSLEKLYQKYNKEVVFLLVSNETQEVVANFKAKNDYEFLVHSSQSEPPKTLQVSSIPRTFIIDKNGQIVVDKTGAANWNSDRVHETLEALLN